MGKKEILAVIPARKGSQGIVNKNIVPLLGKPLIQWTIESALRVNEISRVLVSTDSAEIAGISKDVGAEVPFMRPDHLAQSDTPGIDPIFHALDWLEVNEGYSPEYLILLQPTSPLRTDRHIKEAIDKLTIKKVKSLVSVSLIQQNPYWMKTLDKDGTIKSFLNQDLIMERRQDLPPIYIVNGAIYLSEVDSLMKNKGFYSSKTIGYIMDRSDSIDIDDDMDLKIAEQILSKRM